MMKKVILAFVILTSGLAMGQNSPKAKALLDDVYNKVISYENIAIDFKSVLNNVEANITQELKGNATLQGEKYVVNFLGAQQIFDGKKLHTIVPENEEVTIEDESKDKDAITPSKMLTFYQTGHNYEWDILQTVNGRKIQFIKLTPIDTNSEIKSILLGIDIETKHIKKVIQTGENGTKTTITVNSFKTNQTLSKTLFTFDESKYKSEGYYIIRS